MPQAWSEIVAHYQAELGFDLSDAGFGRAYLSIGRLAEQIERTGLGERLFGWTSMHDLCVQQLDRPPYTCSYLRIAPLRSGQVDFSYVDPPVKAPQWHRIVSAEDTKRRFAGFLNQLKWVDRESADAINA